MRYKTAVSVLSLSYLFLLISCGEWAGFNADTSPYTGDLDRMDLYLNDDELGVLYDSVVVDRAAVCSYEVDGYSAKGEIQIRGLSSRMDPKKSFTLEGTLSEGIKDALDAGGDPWIEYSLVMKAYELAGLPAADFRPLALFLNENYLGYYNMVRIYNDTLNDYYGDNNGELFKITFFGTDFIDSVDTVPIHGDSEKKFPDDNDFSLLDEFIAAAANLSNDEWIDWAEDHVDMEETAKYMAVRDFFGLIDTVRVNFYVYFHDEKALILPWDSDRGYSYDEIGGNNLLTFRMMDSPAFREHYRTQFNKLFLEAGDDNILDELEDHLDRMIDLLRPAVNSETAYFMDLGDFDEEAEEIRTFLTDRPDNILDDLGWRGFFEL
ncbi:MAG: CotH kinase family protein [Spirochaetales bacterium]|nr:CotH kinase family protein [Spirochaetales bacterium]